MTVTNGDQPTLSVTTASSTVDEGASITATVTRNTEPSPPWRNTEIRRMRRSLAEYTTEHFAMTNAVLRVRRFLVAKLRRSVSAIRLFEVVLPRITNRSNPLRRLLGSSLALSSRCVHPKWPLSTHAIGRLYVQLFAGGRTTVDSCDRRDRRLPTMEITRVASGKRNLPHGSFRNLRLQNLEDRVALGKEVVRLKASLEELRASLKSQP